jgi:hypothetical protein
VVAVDGVVVRGTFAPTAGKASLAVTARGKTAHLRLARGFLTGPLLGRAIHVRVGNLGS